MSLKFLNMKGWHPANKTNQRRIWIAEQNARDRAQREQEAAAEVRQSAEQLRFQQLAAASSGDPAAARRAADQQQLGFMYAPPPGLQKPNDAAAARGEDEDADVAAFRRKVDKQRKGGAAAADDHSRDGQRNLERYVGRRPDESLTIKAQVERFPFLKDAPVEGQYTDAVKVNFKPMGRQLRNVRCMRCGEWGHQSGDRECALRDANPHDAARQLMEDPMAQLRQKQQALVLKKASLPLEMQEEPGKEEFEILLSDDDDQADGEDAEREYLAKLSSKEKKKLLKQLKRQEARGSESSSESASDASSRHKKRRKKHTKEPKKEKRKRKSKHESRPRDSDDDEQKSAEKRRRRSSRESSRGWTSRAEDDEKQRSERLETHSSRRSSRSSRSRSRRREDSDSRRYRSRHD